MYKILISGYYGFNNIGDESILRTVIDNLREKLPDVDITVLSQNPGLTAEKYGVKAAWRMGRRDIFRSVRGCDLLLSGGGSLLQDATSRKSILYYLAILALAQLLGKRTFIYSQGIGPITGRVNCRLTALVLRRTDGIVVRDEGSRDLLRKIGVPEDLIHVTADPVIRVKKPDPAQGLALLEREGCPRRPGRLTVGWAVKARKPDKHLLQEVEKCILWLREAYGADSVLIPFFHKEDVGVCAGLVGVRLHSLIYAAVMGVPMIGISYDPKVEAFLASIQRESGFTVKNFCLEGFQKAFRETMENREAIRAGTARSLEELISKLDQNEELIRAIMEQRT